jgi:hypothetical protein
VGETTEAQDWSEIESGTTGAPRRVYQMGRESESRRCQTSTCRVVEGKYVLEQVEVPFAARSTSGRRKWEYWEQLFPCAGREGWRREVVT